LINRNEDIPLSLAVRPRFRGLARMPSCEGRPRGIFKLAIWDRPQFPLARSLSFAVKESSGLLCNPALTPNSGLLRRVRHFATDRVDRRFGTNLPGRPEPRTLVKRISVLT
jgi:hypothetical protein